MAEEQRCQEGHRLCANNCGFFGSPATLNLCSKCYRDLRLKEEQASSAKIAVEKSLSTASPSSPPPLPTPTALEKDLILTEKAAPSAVPSDVAASPASSQPPAVASGPSRCGTCRKRVGLTGFTCRCGAMFCGAHRYPEQHACGFDYKVVGREALARANPVVKAAKLDKI